MKCTSQSVPSAVAGGLDSEEVPALSACTAPGTITNNLYTVLVFVCYGGLVILGQCQAGGELRLSRLQSQGQYVDIPEGFALVGMRSPQLGSLMVLAVVDKRLDFFSSWHFLVSGVFISRYLPDDQTGFSLQGFSGNCVGCGRQGFRYFTEFCHHCNMKLTTQPKKQKHIRFYVIRSLAGVLTRGDPILWRGLCLFLFSIGVKTALYFLMHMHKHHRYSRTSLFQSLILNECNGNCSHEDNHVVIARR